MRAGITPRAKNNHPDILKFLTASMLRHFVLWGQCSERFHSRTCRGLRRGFLRRRDPRNIRRGRRRSAATAAPH